MSAVRKFSRFRFFSLAVLQLCPCPGHALFPSTFLRVCLHFCVSVYISACLSTFLRVRLHFYMRVCLHFCASVYISACVSVYISTSPSACLQARSVPCPVCPHSFRSPRSCLDCSRPCIFASPVPRPALISVRSPPFFSPPQNEQQRSPRLLPASQRLYHGRCRV
jgi:hypothetical protein